MKEVGHNCGISVTHSLHDAYNFAISQQNRGRDATGIAGIHSEGIDVIKWVGPVNTFDLVDLYKILPKDYHTFLTHGRYATRGSKGIEQILNDAHPVVIGGQVHEQGTHMTVYNARAALVHNGQISDDFFVEINPSDLRTGTDSEKLLRLIDCIGEKELLRRVPGAYTLAIAKKDVKTIAVMRDRTGIKPGALGWKDGKYVMASETSALFENGAKFEENLDPGTIYYISASGNRVDKFKSDNFTQNPNYCFFEWNYIGRPDSTINEVSVAKLRRMLGKKLAEEIQIPGADMITFVPRCPEEAAKEYARAFGKELSYVFYKSKAERSFMGADVIQRKKSIERNLFILPHVKDDLRDKEVIVIDDSTVRGTNSVYVRNILYDAGVREAYLLNLTPPMGIIGKDGEPRGCLFGVDMPPTDMFVSRDDDGKTNRSPEEISKIIGMPVHYLSTKGMLSVFEELGLPAQNLCTYCIGGKHPFTGLTINKTGI